MAANDFLSRVRLERNRMKEIGKRFEDKLELIQQQALNGPSQANREDGQQNEVHSETDDDQEDQEE